jgi:cell division protein FtsB
MHEQNERLAAEAKRLQTPAEIQRMAREQYHYVYPGEQAYSVIPAPAPTTSTTTP